MKSFTGEPQFPIWLLADSEPANWRDVLDTPLDPRHPARHNIWTSVLDCLQDRVYRQTRQRFDTTRLFIRNAVTDPADKPGSLQTEWPDQLQQKVRIFSLELKEHEPALVLTFGAFAFEFARRTIAEENTRYYSYWGAKNLGNEFRSRISLYREDKVNLIPLLHVTISRGKFLQSHKFFANSQDNAIPNYFDYAGTQLADLLIKQLGTAPIWVK